MLLGDSWVFVNSTGWISPCVTWQYFALLWQQQDSAFRQPTAVRLHEPADSNLRKVQRPSLFFPHATTRFFSCSSWLAAWLSREPQLWLHANLSHSRCKCEAEYLCIAFTEELSCDIPLCQCVVETKHQLQDIGEQIEHKVSAFHLDSRPHATLGLQSGADVKSSAALLIYGANSVSTCACENYQSARQTKRGGGIIALENFEKSATVHLFHYWNGPIIMGLLRFSEWCLANHVISMW